MYIDNIGIDSITAFREIIHSSKGFIWMQDNSGNEYNLNDEMNFYKVIGMMLSDPDNDLELYTSDPYTEFLLIQFLLGQKKKSA